MAGVLSLDCTVAAGRSRQEAEGNPGPDEEEEREGRPGGQDLSLALPHQLHPAQHCLLGFVWGPRPLVRARRTQTEKQYFVK